MFTMSKTTRIGSMADKSWKAFERRLENERRPWESMGISRSWWYRKYRKSSRVD